MNNQHTESCNALNLQKGHGYSQHPHSKEEIEKKMVLKTSDAKNVFYLLAFNIVLWSSESPRRLWNEIGRLSTSCAFACVLADQQ